MQHATHRQQLDQYAKHDDLLAEVALLYKQYQDIKQQISDLQQQEQQADKIKLLEFQIEELNALHLQEGEITALDQEQQMLNHAQEYLASSQQINSLLHGEEEFNICSGLNQVIHVLHQLPSEQTAIKKCN